MRVESGTYDVKIPTHANNPEHPSDRALREAANGFEEYMFTQMLQALRKTVPKSGLWETGLASDVYHSMLDQAIARGAAQSGGIGIADMLVAQMSRADSKADGARALDAVKAYGAAQKAVSTGMVSSVQIPSGSLTDAGDREAPIKGARLGSVFGPRYSERFKAWKMHYGIDLNAPEGTPIRAAASGVVKVAGDRQGYGLAVYIDHGNGVVTRYGHASKLLVRPGERVAAGQTIALVGTTGRADTAHLHFEVRVNGQAMDPAKWLGPDLMRRAARNYDERMRQISREE